MFVGLVLFIIIIIILFFIFIFLSPVLFLKLYSKLFAVWESTGKYARGVLCLGL